MKIKQIFGAIALTFLATAAWAKVIPVGPITPIETPELSYSYCVVAPAQLHKKSGAIAQQIQAQIAAKGLSGLKMVGHLDSLPDVVFFLGDKSAESDTLMKKARSFDTKIVPLANKSEKILALECFSLLDARYFSGKRPEYSVVFNAGIAGYNNVRIPSVTVTKNGTIVAFIEARAWHKDQAENDLLVRRSTDAGKTWGDVIVAAEDSNWSLNNPMAVYLPEKDRILMIVQSYPPRSHEGVTQNAEGHAMRSYIIYSDDQGATWSEKQDITKQICPEGSSQFCTGPGVGIIMDRGPYKGRIVIPCNAVTPKWFNYLAYSDDMGQTWHVAAGRSSHGTNESQVVQTGDTELLVYARNHRWAGDQSFDKPAGWGPWRFDMLDRCRALIRVTMADSTAKWDTTQIRTDLPDAMSMGSIIVKDNLLLTANPVWPSRMRANGSVRYSSDNGVTWSAAKRIYGSRMTQYQYSVLVPLSGGKVGCLFEATGDIKFAVFDLDWLTR